MWDKVITILFAAIRAFYIALAGSSIVFMLVRIFDNPVGWSTFGCLYLLFFIPAWINSYFKISQIFKD